MSMMTYFKVVLTAQLFYAVCISMLLMALAAAPPSIANSVGINMFNNLPNTNVKDIQDKTTNTFSNQSNFPQANIGLLIFSSGFFLTDLLANFILAVPSMFNILLQVIFMFMPIDAYFQSVIAVFFIALITIIYVIGLVALFASVTTGRQIV